MFIYTESGIRCEHFTSCSYEEQNCNIESLAAEIDLPVAEVENMLKTGSRITTFYDHNGEYTHYEWLKELEVLEYLEEHLEAYNELLAEEETLWALHEENYDKPVFDFDWA